MLDLNGDHLNLVRSILGRFAPNYTVWAFGSRVSGKARMFSDLDLAIKGDEGLTNALAGDIAEAFSESDLPFTVDVVDLTEASAEFREVIEPQMILVQEARQPAPRA